MLKSQNLENPREEKEGKIIQNSFQGYLWLHLKIRPSKIS